MITIHRTDPNECYSEILNFSHRRFSAGEPHVQLETKPLNSYDILVDARIDSMDELMILAVLTTAIRHRRPKSMSLLLPYVPGGRQDRITPDSGHGFTLKVVANLINSLNYDQVYTIDPHSDVTLALLERCSVIDHWRYVSEYIMDTNYKMDYIINPDSGADKRNKRIAKLLNIPTVTTGKTRDPLTGELSGFTLHDVEPANNYLVLDDLCDGGGTFLGLAKAFREKFVGSPARLHLWTTHGIYSKGIRDLLNSFATIGSTDSFPTMYGNPNYFKIEITPEQIRECYLIL